MSKSLTFLSPEELKVGDTVGIVFWIPAGWSRYYRHPCVEKATVEKISAKRKSFKIGRFRTRISMIVLLFITISR